MKRLTNVLSLLTAAVMLGVSAPVFAAEVETGTRSTAASSEREVQLKVKIANAHAATESLSTKSAANQIAIKKHHDEIVKYIKDGGICKNLTAISALMIGDLQNSTSQITAERETRRLKLLASRTELDNKILGSRSSTDDRLAAQLTLLQEKAKADNEKTAVIAFEAAIRSAEATRRAAIDASFVTLRVGVDTAIDNQKQALVTASDAFTFSIATAIVNAKVACDASGANAGAIASKMQTELKKAKATFQTSVKANAESLQINLNQAEATRNKTTLTADNTYKATLEAARAALINAFSDSSAIK